MKGIIFDYDGTLVDTLPQIQKVLNETLTHFMLKTVTLKEVSSYVGDGSVKLVERATMKSVSLTGSEVAKVHDIYIEKYNAESNDTVLAYEGMAEVLTALKARGTKIAVVSNKPEPNVVSGLKDVFPNVEFDYIIGSGNIENLALKPDIAMVDYAIEKLGVAKSETAYIGDTEVDVMVAKNANMKGFAVTWGFRTALQLVDAGANNLLTKPKAILDI